MQSTENVEDILSCELSAFPTSLFDDFCMMREVKKKKLADHLWKKLDNHDFVENIAYSSYVLDGGVLLHEIVWPMRLSSKLSDMWKQITSILTQIMWR